MTVFITIRIRPNNHPRRVQVGNKVSKRTALTDGFRIPRGATLPTIVATAFPAGVAALGLKCLEYVVGMAQVRFLARRIAAPF